MTLSLEEKRRKVAELLHRRIGESGGDRSHPLSFGQRDLWLAHQVAPESPAYNTSFAARVDRVPDVAALRRAARRLAARHPALRTSFELSEGEPIQRVHPLAEPAVEVQELPGSDPERLRHRVGQLHARPFDLERVPLLRLAVVSAGDETVLLVTGHHAILDFDSLQVVVEELGALYGEEAGGRPAGLTSPGRGLPDYVQREREELETVRGREARRHWQRLLGEGVAALDLPFDHPRPAMPAYRGNSLVVPLGEALGGGLRRLAGEQGTTLFAVLLAAYQALLHRLTGERRIVVGTSVADRDRLGFEGTVGYLIQMLPLVGELEGDPTFGELTGRCRRAVLEALEHRACPPAALLHEDQEEGAAPGRPFHTTLSLLRAERMDLTAFYMGFDDGVAMDFGSLRLTPFRMLQQEGQFDLNLEILERRGSLTAVFKYDTDLFGEATVVRLADAFRVLLEGVVEAPQTPLSRLPVLTPEERHRVLVAWNDTERDVEGEPLVRRFEGQARTTPDGIAVSGDGRAWTYRQLDVRANGLAHRLHSLGVGAEVPVAVFQRRTPELVASLLAIHKAGGVYVPLDPEYPRERLALMLEDCAAQVLLVEEGLEDRLPVETGGADLHRLTVGSGSLPEGRDRPPRADLSPETIAYLIYTSGSTGRPKGVMMHHRGIANRVLWAAATLVPSPDDRLLQRTSLSFDASLWELYLPLVTGARLVLAEGAEQRDPDALLEAVAEHRITLLQMVPSLLRAVLEEERVSERTASLRRVSCGGEALPGDLQRRFFQLVDCTLTNTYGPTETAIDVTAMDCRRDGEPDRRILIGSPIHNARVYVLDRHLEPVPVGVRGEVLAAGAGVARGYLGLPRLTADRFVPDPFSCRPGERLYRTGDLGRWRQDGRLEYLGRVDDQVKLRGFRVEPGEVEAVLAAHPRVGQAAVVVRGRGVEARLAAYYAPTGDGVKPEALRSFARRRLPAWMVPNDVVPLKLLPRLPNGKIDRQSLPEPEGGRKRAGHIAPQTAAEVAVAEAWKAVLEVERVGVEDDFFALGGHSLAATRILARLRQSMGVELPVRALFEAPRMATFARRVELATGGADLPPVERREDEGPAPVSFGQRRLWFLDRLTPGVPFYNLPLACHLIGALDVARLEGAVSALVRHHPTLRTVYPQVDGEPVQQQQDPVPIPLPRVDLTAIPETRREEAGREALAAVARQTFDLRWGPLLRTLLLHHRTGRHDLLLATHHVASDAWSTRLLLRDLSVLYRGASELPRREVDYADYAVWQRRMLAEEREGALLESWRRRLEGAPDFLELPTDRPRPAVPSHRGGVVETHLPSSLVEALEEVGRSRSSTLFMTWLAAFLVLLARHARVTDLVVGTPVAGRRRPELEDLVGFFVNNLVLRGDLSGDPPFVTFLERVRSSVLGALEDQGLPFDRLVESLRPRRDTSIHPFFQVLFAVQREELDGELAPGLRLEARPVPTGTARTDLTLVVEPSGDGARLRFEYARDLFDRATVEGLAEQMGILLEGVAGEPETRVSRLPLLRPAQRRHVLEAWNRTASDHPSDAAVHELFRVVARERAAAPAVTYGGGDDLTYGELEASANRLARTLVERGVRPGDRVAVAVERSSRAITALLAILKAGAAYVPLDSSYPEERIVFMLDDARVSLALVEPSLADRIPAAGSWRVEDPTALLAAVEGEPDPGPPPVEVGTQALAYVIYTSGSTGRPKGVAVPHRGIVRLVRGSDYVDFTNRNRIGQASNTSFDAATFEIWGALLNGGVLVGVDRDTTLDPAALARHLRETGITTLFLTTALFNQIVRAEPSAFATTDHLLVGGEALDPRWVRHCLEAEPPQRFLNVYGPTESTTFACCHLVEEVAPTDRSVPIGLPIANTTAHVVDGNLEPVPVGIPGELLIGGDGLAHGYLGRPRRTAAAFVPDPFVEEPGRRLYRTGDLVRRDREGRVDFLGRLDYQVKLRGFRIELGEIEAVLNEHPAVTGSVAMVRSGEAGEDLLVAYAAGRDGVRPDPEELRRHLHQRLPEFMVPAALVPLGTLPLNANGKVDRRALPAPDRETLAESVDYSAPGTPNEELVAGVFGEVLELERVGSRDDFFELGGHSLAATRVASRLGSVFRTDLPLLRLLFEKRTVANLAARLDAELSTAVVEPPPPVEPVADRTRPPLSFAQERLWILHEMAPDDRAYHSGRLLELRGPLEPAVLREALSRVVRRHDVLRATYQADRGTPRQVIHPPAPLELPYVDLTALPSERRREEGVAALFRLGHRSFDLASGPLVRCALVRLEAERHLFVVAMHHMVCDGWSIGVLVRELAAFYPSLLEGRPAPLPELPVQYGDYAAWQREWLSGDVLERLRDFWVDRLADAPRVLDLPADRPRPPVRSFHGGHHRIVVDAGTTGRLRDLGRKRGATLFMTLMAALQVLLSRYSGQRDLLVGTPIANRNRLQVEPLMGFFVNTLVLRGDLSGKPDFGELLERVREMTLDAYQHQDMPFERLVEELEPDRDMSRTPLFQVMFVLQNAGGETMEVPGLELVPLDVDDRVAQFDLTLRVEERSGGLAVELSYARDLYDATTARRMLEHWGRLLEEVPVYPSRPVHRLPLLSATEEHQILYEWNRPEAAGDVPGWTLHQRFAAVASSAADRVAVTGEDGEISYRQLDERSNRLAAHLRELGVGPELRVGICLDRSPRLVEAMLAVLKAGGAYLPLDPAHPQERLDHVLEDAAAKAVITEAAHRDRFVGDGPPVVCLDADAAVVARCPPVAPSDLVDPDHTAYVIYTSGSTGRPKGVPIAHRNVARLLTATERWFGFGPEDVWTLFHAFTFDFSVWELWGPLAYGGRLVVVPYLVSRSPTDFRRLVVEEGVTVLNQTPSAFRQLVGADEEARQDGRGRAMALRTVIFGGEALDFETLRPWFNRHGDRQPRLVNMYGITETTVHVTWRPVHRDDLEQGRTGRIGGPIPDLSLRVLDRHLQPVPAGVAGELCVGGPGLSRGYLNRPALAAERFVPDPFAGRPGGRLYRSGDLARWCGDGDVQYLGRLDHQVKIRGFRIEPGEIEAALSAHPAVREAVVMARRDRGPEDRLVAWVVPRADEALGVETLRRDLGRFLPEHMVPTAFVFLEHIPLTTNGKVDRRALPAPDSSRAGLETPYAAPRNRGERVLTEVLAEVLEIERVGIDDGFFDLGGNSIHALRVVALAGERGLDLDLQDLFLHRTPRELAAALAPVAAEGEPEMKEEELAELDRLLDDMEDLSEAEIQALLEEEVK